MLFFLFLQYQEDRPGSTPLLALRTSLSFLILDLNIPLPLAGWFYSFAYQQPSSKPSSQRPTAFLAQVAKMPSSPVLHDLFKFDIDLASLDGDRNLRGASPIYFNRQAPLEGISLLDPQKRVASASRVSAGMLNMPASSKLKWADAVGSYHYIEVADRSRSLETIVKLIKEEVQRYLIAAGAAKELLAQLSLVGMRQTGPREWQVVFKVRARVFVGYAGY